MARLFLPASRMAAEAGKIPSLDGLRAVSILLVLSAHFIDARLFPGGLGVYVFFIVSGFLITRLLFAEHDAAGCVSLKSFYLRRILRLYPVIIVFTAWVVGMDIALARPYNLLEPASALGYFANYLYAFFDDQNIPPQMPFGVFWSLSVEEHFYILYPPLFVMLQADPKRLLLAVAGLCCLCLGLRLQMAWLHPHYLTTQRFYFESHYRLDSIGFGVILALTCQIQRGRRILRFIARPTVFVGALLAVLVCLAIRDAWFRETVRYTILGCAIDVLLACLLFGEKFAFVQWFLNASCVMWIGRLSYSLYVWHEGVASFLPTADMTRWQAAGLCLAVSLLMAVISFYLVEQPFLALRRNVRFNSPRVVGNSIRQPT